MAAEITYLRSAAPDPAGDDAQAPTPPSRRTAGRPGAARLPVYFNGKFYSGGINGVHRVADRLIRELDALAVEGACPDLDLRLLLPTGDTWAPRLERVRPQPQRLGGTQLWEQGLLPFVARDGVLVNLANLAPLAHGRKLSMIHDAQFVISPRSFPLKFSLGYRLLTPLIARTSARVLTVSEYARDSLESFGVSPHARTVVVPNGAEHILDAPADEGVHRRLGTETTPYALMFATPALYKNLQVVFAAFAQASTGLSLVLVGAGEAALRKAGLHPPAESIYAGPASEGELRSLYERAACLLFPSRTEGFGLPPVEAMTCGCPVIAAPAGAIPEVCRDAILYADVFSPADWTAQMRALLHQPELRRAKIEAGRARAAVFSWRAAGERLLEEIQRIA